MNKKTLIIVCGLLLAGLATTGFFLYRGGFLKGKNKDVAPMQEVGDRVMSYIKENVGEAESSLMNIEQEGDLYKLQFKIADQEFISYTTKDGKLLFPQAIDLDKYFLSLETVKSDRPNVKLFVMSYCPFGLQAQKALLPAWELLKDKADISIYFVDYVMHGKKEIDENLRQYCIQQEEPEKYLPYLACFVRDGAYEKCLADVNIDQEGILACEKVADSQFKTTKDYEDKTLWLNGQYPKFEVNSDLNKKYGVQGSPTLVINDKIVEFKDRSPEGAKKLICNSFNSLPAECSQTLSNETVSPNFGMETGGSVGSCE